ncbi:c-type cytochrome, partial [Rhizobium johnstonii]|uniref:c-type cytochrome n=1 Tax=Rhizobium johnstonii TaxID=3019933 RepID=UPI003F95D1F4
MSADADRKSPIIRRLLLGDDDGSSTIEDGKKLFQANCATCHGLSAEGGDVVRHGLDLFIGELHRLDLRLRAGHLHGHATRADLEVDSGSADADEAGGDVGA